MHTSPYKPCLNLAGGGAADDVHDRVYAEVHPGKEAVGVVDGEDEERAVPAVEHGAEVVVVLQHDQVLFAEHDEDRVSELEHLAHHEEERPEAGGGDGVVLNVHTLVCCIDRVF